MLLNLSPFLWSMQEILLSLMFLLSYLCASASDYYHFDDLLTPEEQAIRKKVRECMEKEVAPIMAKVWILNIVLMCS